MRRVGAQRYALRDLYFSLLRMPWTRLIPFLFVIYIGIVACFTFLYLLDPDGIAGVRPGHVGDVFFFSVETFATIGYGAFVPKSLYAHIVVTVEAFVGMLAVAMLAGLAFAKFSRPTARVIFSNRAVIGQLDRQRVLMIRMANGRESNVVDARVYLTMLRDERTFECGVMRRFRDLQLVRSWTPVFALTWLAVHVIDETSPLYGSTPASLAASNAEIVVTVGGTDVIYAQSVQAQFSYVASEIVWNARFADVIEDGPEGRHVNYDRLHDVEPQPEQTRTKDAEGAAT
jgi:inward rectifier potassium channel